MAHASHHDQKESPTDVLTHVKQETISFQHNRVHEPQLVLLTAFKSAKTHYNFLSHEERKELLNLVLHVYDVYQPVPYQTYIVSTNCGCKTDDNNRNIHWKFDFNIQSFENVFQSIIADTHSPSKCKLLQHHLTHFNQKYLSFSKVQQTKDFVHLHDDIQVYKSLFGDRIPVDCRFKNIHFIKNMSSGLDSNSCAFYIKIRTKCHHPKQLKLQKYHGHIHSALQAFIALVHSTRDASKYYLPSIADSCKYEQAVDWFELSVSKEKTFHSKHTDIIVGCTVTILHFMLILVQNPKHKHLDIQKWFDRYCVYVQNNQAKCAPAQCNNSDHHAIHLDPYHKTFMKETHIGKGSRNRMFAVQQDYNVSNEFSTKLNIRQRNRHPMDTKHTPYNRYRREINSGSQPIEIVRTANTNRFGISSQKQAKYIPLSKRSKGGYKPPKKAYH